MRHSLALPIVSTSRAMPIWLVLFIAYACIQAWLILEGEADGGEREGREEIKMNNLSPAVLHI